MRAARPRWAGSPTASFLSFAVGIFIVHGAIGRAFEQRRGTVNTLRALGVPLRPLVALMVAELVVLVTLAGALGYFTSTPAASFREGQGAPRCTGN